MNDFVAVQEFQAGIDLSEDLQRISLTDCVVQTRSQIGVQISASAKLHQDALVMNVSEITMEPHNVVVQTQLAQVTKNCQLVLVVVCLLMTPVLFFLAFFTSTTTMERDHLHSNLIGLIRARIARENSTTHSRSKQPQLDKPMQRQ
jgi:hypothetical protein